MKKILITFTLFIFFAACNKNNDDPTQDSKYVNKTIQYHSITGVKEKFLSLDISYFDNWSSLKPVVIFIHGGGWSIGDKSNKPNDKIKLFESLDYVYVSINYRLSPFPFEVTNDNRVKHPDHINDVAKAVKYIYDNIKSYGGNNKIMAIMGHSAGAHLASLISTNPQFLNSVGLSTRIFKGAISLDTQAFDLVELMKDTESSNYKMFLNAFGNKPNDQKSASPIYYVVDSEVQNWLVVYRGSLSRVENELDFATALEGAGKYVVKINAQAYSHAEVNDAIGNENDQIINKPIKDFLKTILR